MSTSESIIKCQHLQKSFQQKAVLSDISFTISKCQIFGLLGPSGAGKTTLIKILTGQLSPDGGSVTVLGKKAETLTGEDKRKMGIMMDQFGLYERLTCADNLNIYADIYGISHRSAADTLAAVGLADSLKKPAACLSKGMTARLKLARAFIHSPEILFLDEPTSGLDPASMQTIHQLILKKKQEGCTIFLTTHNMEEAASLCDTVALLNDGVIVDQGAPDKLYLRYNYQKQLFLHLTDGKDIILPQSGSSAESIYAFLKEEQIITIHSSEPTLETVFLELTGKSLQEEE